MHITLIYDKVDYIKISIAHDSRLPTNQHFQKPGCLQCLVCPHSYKLSKTTSHRQLAKRYQIGVNINV